MPTKKWWAALVGGLTPILIQAVDTGWGRVESKMTITLASALALAWIWRNDPEQAGVKGQTGQP